MKASIRGALLAVALLLASAATASAQSDILLRLRSGAPLGDRFRVDSAGGVVAIAQLGIGIIPATGCGWRMMWHAYNAAFRVGSPGDTGVCDAWDPANVGFYTFAGGFRSKATQFAGFAFGDQVEVTAVDATGFGASNTVSGTAGFAAGAAHLCSGFGCTTLGYTNSATGQGSVAIGYRVTADASYSVSLGHRASANGFAGTFNIADQSTTDSVEASTTNQFNSRYAGGYRLYTNATTTTGVSLNAGGSSWNVISDRNRKENFLSVDGEDVLSRIRRIPVTSWNYISEGAEVRHIGPVAQDWHAAFGLNDDPLTINSGDFDGVNLAAIQALDARTAGQAEEIGAVRGEARADHDEQARLIADLQARNAELEARIARLEALLAGAPQP